MKYTDNQPPTSLSLTHTHTLTVALRDPGEDVGRGAEADAWPHDNFKLSLQRANNPILRAVRLVSATGRPYTLYQRRIRPSGPDELHTWVWTTSCAETRRVRAHLPIDATKVPRIHPHERGEGRHGGRVAERINLQPRDGK